MKNPVSSPLRISLAALFLLCQGAFSATIEVMTQNQYLGTDLTPLVTATTPAEFNDALISALKQVAANNAPARIAALSDLIIKRKPHLVGLQEVYAFGCLDPYGTGACSDPAVAGAFNDHLALTRAALHGTYEAAAVVNDFNVPGIPFDLYETGVPAFVTVLDRDVILRRADVVTSVVDFSGVCTKPSADGCNYYYVLPVTTP